ncbi:type II toxin-antitoxin system HicA family toxin [Nocardiopsis metallicus]|uniref:Putative RNA binding protein YcfA (HicA-like mRNA interferase family) n=1 Tax=Nocardiopsis metallicus TaxID=179819 RepID=A0A840WHL9_9ACTN|nr:type II toxin-antitoxin system HicA family toxin [Nocardiopsis metallicus]MBB5495782.1 putative RNA binding protein YcfA (HicA-like mRNA interferase family) [Nocardiopsis metallicus]
MSPSQIPITSGSKVVRALERAGWEHVSTRGSHAKLRKGPRRVVVPLHKEIKRGTLAGVLAEVGMSPQELRELL